MTRNHRVSIIAMLAFFLFSFVTGQQSVAQNKRRTTVKYVKKPVRIQPRGKRYAGYNKQPAGKAVDLGLSVLWADRNVGSASPSDEGGMFLWGSVTGMLGKMAEAERKPDIPEIFNSTFDTAHMCWGGDWRMPSMKDFVELFTKCKVTLVKDADGWESILKFTGPNGNSILLPMTGEVPNNSEPYRYKWPDGNYWIGETNRDSVGWHDRHYYKLGRFDKCKINQPFCAHIDLMIVYNSSTRRCDPYSFSIYSLCDYSLYEQLKHAMAVRPVMDRDGLPTRSKTVTPGKSSATSKGDAPTRQNTTPHKGGQPNKGTGTTSKSTGTVKPLETDCGGTPTNGKTQNPDGGKGKPGQGAKPSDGNAPTSKTDNGQTDGTSQAGGTPQKDAPIPTPKPDPNPDPDSTRYVPGAVERAVDLGLSVYWSDRNVGASSVADPGQYFFWGDKDPKKLEKQKVPISDIPINVGSLNGTENDIVTKYWGLRWRTPTKEEINELISNCTFKLDSVKGQHGLRVTGKTKKSIFIPFGGGYDPYDGKMLLDSCAVLWSADECPSESDDEIPVFANGGVFYSLGFASLLDIPKCLLANLRPVTKTLLVRRRTDNPPCHVVR